MFVRLKVSRFLFPAVIGWILLVSPQFSTAQNRITKLPDLNGDGISDLIWNNPSNGQSVSWLMNGTSTSVTAALPNEAGWTIAAAADFNGDGTTDLIWQDPSTGQIIEWLMNGVSINSSTLLLNDPFWNVVEAADLNGDGMSDLVMYNASTGQTVAWLMNGSTIASWSLLRTDPLWRVIASNDFNADGMSDLLWFNTANSETALWLMNGTALLSSATIGTDASWAVQTTADFNLDKMADILWYKASTGETSLWLMNGTASISRTTVQLNPNFKPATTGDLNGDGRADLLWHNISTGQSEAWLMDGPNILSIAVLQSDVNWKIQSTGDLNGDKKSDILWYNSATGQTALWLMDGTAGIGGTNLFTDPIWKLQCIKTSSLTSALACDRNAASASAANTPIPPNQAPIVNAGSDQTITFPETAALSAILTDDRIPIGLVTTSWSVVSGAGSVTFSDRTKLATTASFSAAGTYTLRLTATDSQLTSSNTVIVVVGGSSTGSGKKKNQAPVVDAGPDQTISMPRPAALEGSATDDGLPYKVLTASWRKVNGPGNVIFSQPASMSSVATFSAPGSYTLRLTVTDGSLSRNDDVVIVAEVPSAANKAPVVNAGADQMITLPASANLSGTVTDDGLPTGGALTRNWSKVGGAGTVTFGSASSPVTTAAFSAAGSYTLRLTASDGKATTTDDVIVVVSAAASTNKAPVVNAGPDQTVSLPAGPVLVGTATDDGLPSGCNVTVSWSKVSGPGTVIFVNVNSLNASAAIQTAGTYTLRLTATDGTLSSSDDIVITVNATSLTNKAPVVNAGPDATITLPGGLLLSGSATDDRLPAGSPLTAAWSRVSGPSTVTFGNASALNSQAAFPASGTYTLRLTASDGSLSSFDDVVVVVNAAAPANTAPVVNAGPDFTITLPSGITLAGSATDDGLPTGSTIGKTWSQVNGPGVVSFGNAASLNSTANFPVAGTYTLRFTASDGLLSSSDDVVFVVNAAVPVAAAAPSNTAPVVNAGPDATITLPGGLALSGSVSDDGLPTASTLTRSWSRVSGPSTVTFSNASALNSQVAFPTAGTYTLRLTASDGSLSSFDDLVVVVNAPTQVNQAPVVNAGPDFTITLPSGITLAGSASDDGLPSGSTFTKTWSKISGPGTIAFGNVSSLSSSANFSMAGTYILRLTASDGSLSASDDVTFVVNAAPANNLAPIVNAGSDQTITFPGTATLTGTATDDGLPSGTLTKSWTKVSGPGTVTFVNGNSLNASATFSLAGSYTLRLTATDGSLTSSDDLNVLVNPCGTIVNGLKTLLVNAADNVGVISVQLKLDGVNLGSTITSAPYALNWDTTAAPNGCHQITVVAQDAAGNQGTASLATLVNNP